MAAESPDATAKAEKIQKKLENAGVSPDTLKAVLTEWSKREEEAQEEVNGIDILDRKIAHLRDQLNAQIREVMRNEAFRKLESTWRGLNRLVEKTEHSDQLILEVIDATKESVIADLGPLSGPDDDDDGDSKDDLTKTKLYYHIYRNGLGILGGEPYSAIIADFDIGPDETSMAVLWKLAQIAEKAQAPVIANASPSMFRMEALADLNPVAADLRTAQGTDDDKFNRWRTFRKKDSSAFAGLLVPRVLMRAPYKLENAVETEELLWGSPVYAYAEILNRSFYEHGWCWAIRGPHGTLADLPIHQLQADDSVTQVGPTEMAFDDSIEWQFDCLGFIAFCKRLHSTEAVFPGGHSCKAVATWSKAAAQASAELSARLPHVFARSRFAHAVKVMCREMIGTFKNEKDVKTQIEEWLSQYKLDSPDAHSDAEKAKQPLANYKVEAAKDKKGRAGFYDVKIDLELHYQVEAVNVQMSIVGEVSGPQG